jgi:Lyase
MPGKVNPTQQEAMVMVCLQVLGEDSIVVAAGAQGNFELNAMRPIIMNNVLHCARILGDACDKLRRYSVEGTKLDQPRVTDYVSRSLMLVTALSPTSGTTRPRQSPTRPATMAPPCARRHSRWASPPSTSTGSSIRSRWWATRVATSDSRHDRNGPPIVWNLSTRPSPSTAPGTPIAMNRRLHLL